MAVVLIFLTFIMAGLCISNKNNFRERSLEILRASLNSNERDMNSHENLPLSPPDNIDMRPDFTTPVLVVSFDSEGNANIIKNEMPCK